jgi:flagellar protein FliL
LWPEAATVPLQETQMPKDERSNPDTDKKSMMVPILLATNVLSLGGGIALFFFASGSGAELVATEEPVDGPKQTKWAPTVDVGNFTINLANPGTSRYLKAVVKASVSSEQTKVEVEKRNAQLRDVIISYLSSLQLEETQGARAKEDIRENLRKRINNLLRTGEATDIFFTEFVTQ